MQFGGGNFLRAFADWMIDRMNKHGDFNAGVTVIKPTAGKTANLLNKQNGLYTVFLNGIKNGEVVSDYFLIDCIREEINPYTDYNKFMETAAIPDYRFIISNTTEAGITYDPESKLTDTPQKSFPGKLTAWLYKRFQNFNGDPEKGVIVLPCELIPENGSTLKNIILQHASDWELDKDFTDWIEIGSVFCNTLVDRIVPGFPTDKTEKITSDLGYRDNLTVEAEQYHFWAIEGPEKVQEAFPADQYGLNVIFTKDLAAYQTRKVRILNGAHTAMVPVGILSGLETVQETIENADTGRFVREAVFKEICPALDLPEKELTEFANDTIDRFRNPHLKHLLMSIALNSISKYKTRILPSLIGYARKTGTIPRRLSFSLAALIVFYSGKYNGRKIALKDDPEVLAFFQRKWKQTGLSFESIEKLVLSILEHKAFWGVDLTAIKGLPEKISCDIQNIRTKGIRQSLKDLNRSEK